MLQKDNVDNYPKIALHKLEDAHIPTNTKEKQAVPPCNWDKSTQTLLRISIKPYFRVRKSYPTSSQEDGEKMVRPWVKVSLCQYQELKRLTEKKDKSLSGIIREAVGEFLKKKDFPTNTTVSSLARGTRNGYKSVSAYFLRSDWNLLEEISRNTGKCKTKLVRQALDEYLGR